MMKKMATTIMSLALAGGAVADSFITRARVLESAPIIETVYEPYEECRYETRVKRRRDNTGDKVLGGILGGAAGSALGKGSGRDAAAGVGAILGSEVAAQDGALTEGEIIGGIVGGIVGNQIGKGGGKTAATGAGALIGAIVGDNLQNGGSTAGRTTTKERVCEQKERTKKVITGYEVVYEYDGVRQTGVLSYKPGNFVDINVGVDLVEDRTARVIN